jgi:hypothetical protein
MVQQDIGRIAIHCQRSPKLKGSEKEILQSLAAMAIVAIRKEIASIAIDC